MIHQKCQNPTIADRGAWNADLSAASLGPVSL